MQAGRASNRSLVTSPETATEQMALPFDYVVTRQLFAADSREVKLIGVRSFGRVTA